MVINVIFVVLGLLYFEYFLVCESLLKETGSFRKNYIVYKFIFFYFIKCFIYVYFKDELYISLCRLFFWFIGGRYCWKF